MSRTGPARTRTRTKPTRTRTRTETGLAKDKDKDLNLVPKESLRTRINITGKHQKTFGARTRCGSSSTPPGPSHETGKGKEGGGRGGREMEWEGIGWGYNPRSPHGGCATNDS